MIVRMVATAKSSVQWSRVHMTNERERVVDCDGGIDSIMIASNDIPNYEEQTRVA